MAKAGQAYDEQTASVPATEQKADEPLTASMITAEDVPEEEWGEHSLTLTRPRGEFQQVIDALVKDLHDQWKTAGSPDLRKSPRKKLTVPVHKAADVRAKLTKAGVFHNVAVKWGDERFDPNGHAVITFTARDKQTKNKAAAAAAPVSE